MSMNPLHPDWTDERPHSGDIDSAPTPDLAALAGAYRTVADAFVYPENINREAYLDRARTEVVPAVDDYVDGEAAERLASFLDAYEAVGVDEFVATLELEPECPPYLGHHEFDAPETCRDIADADRNQYMVELNAIYEHFGFEIGDELPDYLPAMVEFCWLTLPERDDDVRAEFVGGMLSLLPGIQDAFEAVDTPYDELLVALERLLEYDLSLMTSADSSVEDIEPDGPSIDVLDEREDEEATEGTTSEIDAGGTPRLDPAGGDR